MRLTNGPAEAVNGLIQTAKRKSRGFRSFDYFRVMIYLSGPSSCAWPSIWVTRVVVRIFVPLATCDCCSPPLKTGFEMTRCYLFEPIQDEAIWKRFLQSRVARRRNARAVNDQLFQLGECSQFLNSIVRD
jgi:hypothetical protein